MICASCHKSPANSQASKLPQDIAVEDVLPIAKAAKCTLKRSQVRFSSEGVPEEWQSALGEWRLAIEGGNRKLFDLPYCIHLMPQRLSFSWAKGAREMIPELPEPHGVGTNAYWRIDQNHDLILTWSEMSSLQIHLTAVSETRWEGYLEARMDFSWPGMDEPERHAVILERRTAGQ